MNKQEITNELQAIKSIQPDAEWKEKNKVFLLNYINEHQEAVEEKNTGIFDFTKLSQLRLKYIAQPMVAVFLITFIVLSGGLLSLNAAKDTKPGDSLYIAKIINEKTQLALTFNEKKKVRLGLTFASNRAKELSMVLAESSNQENHETVERLVSDIKKEINIAKERLARIEEKDASDLKSKELPISTEENIRDENLGADADLDEDNQVFKADLGKEDRGLQVSSLDNEINISGEDEADAETVGQEDEGVDKTEVDNKEAPTSTEAVLNQELESLAGTSTPEVLNRETPGDIAKIVEEQVEELLNHEDINHGELTKLEEAIDKASTGTVKGESEEVETKEIIIDEELENIEAENSTTTIE